MRFCVLVTLMAAAGATGLQMEQKSEKDMAAAWEMYNQRSGDGAQALTGGELAELQAQKSEIMKDALANVHKEKVWYERLAAGAWKMYDQRPLVTAQVYSSIRSSNLDQKRDYAALKYALMGMREGKYGSIPVLTKEHLAELRYQNEADPTILQALAHVHQMRQEAQKVEGEKEPDDFTEEERNIYLFWSAYGKLKKVCEVTAWEMYNRRAGDGAQVLTGGELAELQAQKSEIMKDALANVHEIRDQAEKMYNHLLSFFDGAQALTEERLAELQFQQRFSKWKSDTMQVALANVHKVKVQMAEKKKMTGKKKMILAFVIAVVAVAGLFAYYFMYANKDSAKEEK